MKRASARTPSRSVIRNQVPTPTLAAAFVESIGKTPAMSALLTWMRPGPTRAYGRTTRNHVLGKAMTTLPVAVSTRLDWTRSCPVNTEGVPDTSTSMPNTRSGTRVSATPSVACGRLATSSKSRKVVAVRTVAPANGVSSQSASTECAPVSRPRSANAQARERFRGQRTPRLRSHECVHHTSAAQPALTLRQTKDYDLTFSFRRSSG
jgi:hypothetical protein